MLTENAPAGRRGFYGSFAQMGAPIGAILSNVVFLAVSALAGPDGLISWAWRIPFLLSLALIGVALVMQFKLQDTVAFRAIQLGGALAPLVATTLLVRFGTPLAISIYMAAMCLITICAVWLMAEQPAAPRHAL